MAFIFHAKSGVPKGAILLWSGSIATIPSGWHLCDGNSGTPDLRNMFIVGANADYAGVAKTTIEVPFGYAETKTGGSINHKHYTSIQIYGSLDNGTDIMAGFNYWNSISGTATGFTDENVDIITELHVIPVPYYALAYIMKL